MNRRNLIRGAALLAAVAVVYFAPEPESGVVAPMTRTSSQPPAPRADAAPAKPAGSVPEVLAIRPRLSGDEENEAFVQVAWEKPAPPPSAAKVKDEPPPPPQAPPLPFKVLGQYSERGEVGVFLQHNDKNLVVRVGDTIADHYKVESLKDGVMTLVYLPLQQQQTLVVSAPN